MVGDTAPQISTAFKRRSLPLSPFLHFSLSLLLLTVRGSLRAIRGSRKADDYDSGIVRKGMWIRTPVAIKTFKTAGGATPDREVGVKREEIDIIFLTR